MGILDGRIIIVTGASSGIGRACAIHAAKEGAKVVLAARRKANIDEVAELIKKNGGEAVAVQCDVLNESDIDNVVETTVKEFGRIDGLANIAQAAMDRQICSCDDLTKEDAMEFYLGGPWSSLLFIRKVAPYMKEAGGGRVVNACSHVARIGIGGQVGYAMAKGAIEALTRQAAVEYGKQNILINAILPQVVNPEFIKTDLGKKLVEEYNQMSPLGYVGSAEDCGPLVSYLLSDRCHYMTGQFIGLDAGIKFFA